jgi:hypothetical protein
MTRLRLFSLLTAWALSGGAAFATTAPPVVNNLLSGLPPAETTPVHHATPTNDLGAAKEPIVVNWQFSSGRGLAHLIVNPDGTYLYSGHYTDKPWTAHLSVTIALKSRLAGVYLFRYVVNLENPPFEWSREGKSAILKDDFKSFAGPHDWAGQLEWVFPASPQARQTTHTDEKCTPQERKDLSVIIGTADKCTRFDSN